MVNFDENRHYKAKTLFDKVSEKDFVIYEPFLFDVELAGILRRRYDETTTSNILNDLKDKIEIIDEPPLHKIALNIAIKTHCRAIDSYFIATAKITSSILITNDKIMDKNAKKFGTESYYLIDDFDEVMKKLETL